MSQRSTTLRNIIILIGGMIPILVSIMLGPVLPDMAKAFADVPNGDALVRLSLTLPALFVAIGSPPAGTLLDRWGRKPVIIISLIGYGVAGTAGYFLQTLPAILISRAVFGLAVAGITSGFTTLIADIFTGENLNRFMGYQGAVLGYGGVLFQLLAGGLGEFNWRLPFLVYLIAFLVLIGVLVVIQEPERDDQDTAQGDQGAGQSLPVSPLFAVYGAGFLSMVAMFVMLVFVPFQLASVTGASNFQIGIALAMQTLVSGTTSLLYQRIKPHFSFEVITALVMLTVGINHVLVATTSSYMMITLALMIGGIGIGFLPPNFVVWLTHISPLHLRGRLIATLFLVFSVAQFLAPIAFEPVFAGMGASAVYLIVGIGSFVVALIYGLVLPRIPSLAESTT